MQAMASSHINSREADEIIKFLAYDESHRKAAERDKTATNPNDPPEIIGKQLYDKYGCSACHSGASQGGGFSLDGIGSRRTRTALKQLIISPPSGSTMPATTASDQEVNYLVALTLKITRGNVYEPARFSYPANELRGVSDSHSTKPNTESSPALLITVCLLSVSKLAVVADDGKRIHPFQALALFSQARRERTCARGENHAGNRPRDLPAHHQHRGSRRLDRFTLLFSSACLVRYRDTSRT